MRSTIARFCRALAFEALYGTAALLSWLGADRGAGRVREWAGKVG